MSYFELGQHAAQQFIAGNVGAVKLALKERNRLISYDSGCPAGHGSRPANDLEAALHAAFRDGWEFAR